MLGRFLWDIFLSEILPLLRSADKLYVSAWLLFGCLSILYFFFEFELEGVNLLSEGS